MRLRFFPLLSTLLLSTTLLLAGCETSEERAERFYQSGLTLLEAGDVDRALVEFRNVFNLDGQHRGARETYARIQRERGAFSDAFGQYLRLVEQHPDALEGRIALAEMSIEANNWEEAERHGRAAKEQAPQDPKVITVNAMLDYREAVLADDRAAAEAPVAVARTLLESDPSNLIARRLVIDHLVNTGDTRAALPEVEAGLQVHPDNLEFHMIKIRLLAETGDTAGTEAALETMSDRFPENEQIRQMLIAWYAQQGDLDKAEAFLRRLADAPDATQDTKLTVVAFLQQVQGLDAAQIELDRLISVEPENKTYKAMRAAFVFEGGDQAGAIAQMEELLSGIPTGTAEAQGEGSTDEVRNIKVALARMLVSTNDVVGARIRVEEVLVEDPSHVEALKMKAAWLIEEDKPSDAIIALRSALSQSPRDTSVITMMGQAHEREGSRDLAGERYALAVDVSNRGPAESLRYASFLLESDRIDTAQSVIEDSLRANPTNVPLLSSMADIQMRQSDWSGAAATIAQLRSIGSGEATRAANELEAGLMLRQQKVDDTVSFLQGLIDSGEADTAAIATIVQARVRSGDLTEAREYLDIQLTKAPDDPSLRLLNAGLLVLENDPAKAEAVYRDMIADFPQEEQPVGALYALLLSQDRAQDASAVLAAALTTMPQSVTLKVMRAGELEKGGDIDGAIAIYEAIYSENSNNTVIANNLASLIGTYRTDPESLDRAFSIARRLRGTDVPAFQDTYGWIEYRRGNYEEALNYLEPAAAKLPQDPLVQYHLGMTYVALQRTEQAREILTRALEIAGSSPLPQFAQAREELEKLREK